MNAKRIKELRQRLGMTLNQFAQLLNVSSVTVRRWESGKHAPIPSLQYKLRELETTPNITLRASESVEKAGWK